MESNYVQNSLGLGNMIPQIPIRTLFKTWNGGLIFNYLVNIKQNIMALFNQLRKYPFLKKYQYFGPADFGKSDKCLKYR